jgi:Arc/MetJ family transcription regulator
MIRRTTIDLDEELVAEAQSVLGQATIRATVEEALRQAVRTGKTAERERRQLQIDAMKRASRLIDNDVLLSNEAWR